MTQTARAGGWWGSNEATLIHIHPQGHCGLFMTQPSVIVRDCQSDANTTPNMKTADAPKSLYEMSQHRKVLPGFMKNVSYLERKYAEPY